MFNIFSSSYPVNQDCSYITYSSSDVVNEASLSSIKRVKTYCFCLDIINNSKSPNTGCTDFNNAFYFLQYIAYGVPLIIAVTNYLIALLFKSKV